MVDFVIYTEEHKDLTHDNSGNVKCEAKNGWSTYYDCFNNIVKNRVKQTCALPFNLETKKQKNCTNSWEIKEYQNTYLTCMYEVQKNCLEPCNTRTYDIQARIMHNGNKTSNATVIWYMHGSHKIGQVSHKR